MESQQWPGYPRLNNYRFQVWRILLTVPKFLLTALPLCAPIQRTVISHPAPGGAMRNAIASAMARIAMNKVTKMTEMFEMIPKDVKVKKFKNIYYILLELLLQKF